jgi:hypothetical protein
VRTLSHAKVALVADIDNHRLASLNLDQPWVRATTRAEEVFLSVVDGLRMEVNWLVEQLDGSLDQGVYLR